MLFRSPLIEIVSEPDLRTPEEAVEYFKSLRNILLYMEICDGNMEEGSLRCDANISLRPVGRAEFGTKAELKNMNSFRFVRQALEYEIKRQRALLDAGKEIIQETRLWDTAQGQTVSMRGKEEAHDYRYFPDPDLPPLVLDPEWIESIRQSLPELPDARRRRWMAEYRLSEVDAALLSEDRAVADYFEELARLSGEPKSSANWVMGEVSRLVNETKMSIDALRVRPSRLRDLMALIRDGVISHSAGKKVFAAMAGTGEDPESAMRRLGLAQVSDAGTLEAEIRRVVEANPDPLNRYLAGNEKLFGFFVGEVMKATKGKANPKRVNEILKKWLDGLQNQE